MVLPAAQPDRKQAEASLRSVTERLERIQRQVQQDSADKDRLSRELREAERLVSRAHGDLSKLRSQRAERAASRQRLIDERARRQAERDETANDLETQLRAAYFMGRNEPLKLLLNQRNPAQFGRNLTYYGYLGRLRATQIKTITGNIFQIDELTSRIDEEDAKLAALEGEQKARVGELESARRQRGRVLASLQKEAQNRTATLARLQKQQQQLERLLKDLSRVTESAPFDPNDPFGKLRGKLTWPVAGRIATSFGETVVGTLRSNGLEIDADRGANVRAVHEGRVVYSDWFQGRGLLLILDHGNNYISIYGHNEQLLKAAGSRVAAGETIATAGDSGGRKTPGLYFEIRKSGKPVDPRGWFRTGTPPAG
ncbi:MAG: peptidoglycan DD-metalloendopeptidase family protein [Steroidobacteraceae bacterium]